MIRPDLQEELDYYIDILYNSEEGKEARKYLKSRSIKKSTAEFWELGYCPIGCIPPNYNKDDEYKPYEKMWGRLIIPIKNQNGDLISLSGRLLKKVEGIPKYDHYSFPSRQTLFGLYQNRNDIRKLNQVNITEGQFDVISAWQCGITNICSSFGAHFSEDHLAILSRYTNEANIIYDEDFAGNKGTNNIKKLSSLGDMYIYKVTNLFNEGEDLDEWSKKHTKEEFYDKIENNRKLII